MYYVYIIYSSRLNKFYIGYSTDLQTRIKKHNSNGSNFTKNGIPWVLAHYQGFLEKEDAQREEKFLKTGKGRERIKFLLEKFIRKNK